MSNLLNVIFENEVLREKVKILLVEHGCYKEARELMQDQNTERELKLQILKNFEGMRDAIMDMTKVVNNVSAIKIPLQVDPSTVKELIEVLQKMNPEAVLCSAEFEGDNVTYYSIELCKEISNATYCDDNGIETKGDIVVLI